MGRFREILSDPLNLAITRDPRAGLVEEGYVYLHNGLRVPFSGPLSYYGEFSKILVINRGVHEPLEEYVFQELLKKLPNSPVMLELGAYWGHYSMWLKKVRTNSIVHLVEPELNNLNAGINNFGINSVEGCFVQGFVGKGKFEIDAYCKEKRIEKLDILHSDIQGYELEMLDGGASFFSKCLIDYVFVSTHSQDLHHGVLSKLNSYGYRIEVSSDFDDETTSFDGIVFASSPTKEPLFSDFVPMGRTQIAQKSPVSLIDYLVQTVRKE